MKTGELTEQAAREGIQRYVVGAVIVRAGEVLLLERALQEKFMPGLMELPSGAANAGEDILDALQREVFEETKLSIHAVKQYLGSFDYQSRSGKRVRQFNFLVEAGDGEVQLNAEEHSSYSWVNLQGDRLNDLTVSDETKTVILQIIDDGNS